jgi:hypothetical protein
MAMNEPIGTTKPTTPLIDFNVIDRLTNGRVGIMDTPCPVCSALRRPANQHKRVFRIWRSDPHFATYHCVHCLERGYAHEGIVKRVDPVTIERVKREAAQRQRLAVAERLSKARWLWSKRLKLSGSIGETYLREARGYRGLLPETLGFLPGRSDHPPAMIAAFGIPEELMPGRLAIADTALRGVHITRLAADGGKAATEPNKLMIGPSAGSPIVLAPPNDSLGLVITEGIEEALSIHEATGLGAWAAGCASRLPGLADAIPHYIDCVTINVDDDDDGYRYANELGVRLSGHSCHAQFFEHKRLAA